VKWLLFTLAISSCAYGTAQNDYFYKSPEGGKCYYSCEERYHRCESNCESWRCHSACDDSIGACMNGCPDVGKKEPVKYR